VSDQYFETERFTKNQSTHENSEFIDCSFDGVDLQNSSFKNSKLIDCKFINCNLSNSNVLNASFSDIEFINCKLTGINWSTTRSLREPRFKDCLLNLNSFQTLDLVEIEATGCSFKESDFSGANLRKANIQNSDFSGALFHEANLEEADFSGAKNYFIDPSITKIKGAKFSTPDVYSFFKTLKIKVDGN